MNCTSINYCPGGDHCKKCSHALTIDSITVNGRVWRFEYSPVFGPTVVGKRSKPLKNQPGSRNPFWTAFEEWQRVNGQGSDQKSVRGGKEGK